MTQLMDEMSSQKHLPEWLQAMCRGKINNAVAWNWRGRGYANTVRENAWKPFEKHQKIAGEEFERAYKINPLFPESASYLISISLTGHNEKSEDYWFERAIKGQADHMPAYENRLYSLLPQWGGSVEKMFEFTKRHVEKESNETQVSGVIVDFLSLIHI